MSKKIAFFTVSMKGGGAERVISLLLEKLHNHYEIYLILLDSEFDYKIPSQIKVHTLSSILKKNVFFNILQIPILAWQLCKFIKENNIETCFSFLNRPNWINCFTKFYNAKNKIIISERTTPSIYYNNKSLNGKIGLTLIKKLYPNADLILPNSQGVKFDLEKLIGKNKNIRVIYNPINLPINKKEKQKKNEKFTFIFVARFQYPKDHVTILRAFKKVQRNYPNTKLQFLGAGENEVLCKKMAMELEISQNVEFLGFDNNPQYFLNIADCFVFSSFFEGFPNVILEAMAYSLPVISTDCFSGPREMIAPESDYRKLNSDKIEFDEYGILVPVRNEELMSVAMGEVLNNSEMREIMSKNSFERALYYSNFDYISEIKSII